eukprot:scaffold1110_cov182-Ochromonas_danica.AAC.18
MIELRKRSKSGGSYRQLSTDENIDSVSEPLLFHRPKAVPQSQSFFCVVFLSTVAWLLAQESPYLRLSGAYNNRKAELANAVVGAIVMYMACFVVACLMLWRRRRVVAQPIVDARFVD